jgi:Na+(H+)/acetate symporter ActP
MQNGLAMDGDSMKSYSFITGAKSGYDLLVEEMLKVFEISSYSVHL